MAHVFISYSRHDIEFVHKLAEQIGRVYKVWIDMRGIEPADDFQKEIEQGIKTSSAFVVVLSPNSVSSDYVNGEINRARKYDIPIIPYMYRPVDPPLALTSINYIEHDEENHYQSIGRLLDRLKKSLGNDACIQGGGLIGKEILDKVGATFASTAAHSTGRLSFSAQSGQLIGLPVIRNRYHTAYFIGYADDLLMQQDNLQLAIQLTGDYPFDDFVIGIADYLHSKGYPLQMLLIRGPLSEAYQINEPHKSHYYGLKATNNDEWQDALETTKQASVFRRNKTLQLFIKGPAVFLFRFGEIRRSLKNTELYHFERNDNYYKVL
jgi:hypothetical protein